MNFKAPLIENRRASFSGTLLDQVQGVGESNGACLHAMIEKPRMSIDPSIIATNQLDPNWHRPMRFYFARVWGCLLLLILLGCQSEKSPTNELQASSASPVGATNGRPKDSAASEPTTPLVAREVRYTPLPFSMPQVTNPGYVGYQQCVECHSERVAECVATSHFQACRTPSAERMPAVFNSDDVRERTLSLPGSPVDFEMSVRDGKYLQTAINSTTGRKVDSTIDLIYGAKPVSDEVYLSWHDDGSMRELPAAWIYATDCWGAAGFNRQQGTDFARELTVRCFECHNTWFEHVPGTLATYRRDGLIMGVTCERCHGPAKKHVDFHRTHPEDKKPQAILYPGSLERERLIEVCTQCHSNTIRHRGPALSFRPGQVLADHYRTVNPKYDEDDHVANQITSLRGSKCFQQSQMTCITCHDPHVTGSAPHGMTFRESCLDCHQQQGCKERERLPEQVADKCVDCHMRRYAKINVNFDLATDSYVPPLTRRQHQIAIDPIATAEVLLAWYRSQAGEDMERKAKAIVQELTDHWIQLGQQRAQAGRFTAASAAMRELLRIDPESAEATRIMQEYHRQQRAFDDQFSSAEIALRNSQDLQALDLFSKILEIQPDNATALGRLGTLYAKRGDQARAVDFYQRAAAANPDDQYGVSMLAWLELTSGNYERAAELYAKADAIEPFNSKLNQLWGTALLKAGNVGKAKVRLQVAQQSDPRNVEAIRQLVSAHLQLSEFEQAANSAVLVAQLTEHQSLPDLMALAECQLARGEKQLAADVVQLALGLAATTNRDFVATIRQWAQDNGVALK